MIGLTTAKPIRDWERIYGPLPRDYIAIDVETDGLSPTLDRVLQIGLVRVENCKAVLSKTHLVNWTATMSPEDLYQFSAKLDRTRQAMAKQGKQYQFTTELLDDLGEPPEIVAIAVKNFLGPEPACVGHFAWQFDYPFIFNFMRNNNSTFTTIRERLYDTCLLTRACLVHCSPMDSESLPYYYHRLYQIRGAPSCKIEACVARFELEKSGVDTSSTHEAGYDAWASHLIFEKLREAANEGT